MRLWAAVLAVGKHPSEILERWTEAEINELAIYCELTRSGAIGDNRRHLELAELVHAKVTGGKWPSSNAYKPECEQRELTLREQWEGK